MSIVAINAEHPEEIRVATFDKQQVSNLYIENTRKQRSLKDIYAGVVRSIEPSLEAVFIEYRPGRHGFLQLKDIAVEYCKNFERHNLRTSLKVGQSIIVQVKKEERGTKGAALTTYITLPGTYLVLMPNHSSSGGVSKQLASDMRKDMQHVVNQLNPPANMSVILRTAGAERSIDELQRDLMLLVRQWDEIKKAFKSRKAPFLIFQEGDILARTMRDYVREGVTEIMIDDPSVFEKTKDYAAKIRPELVDTLRLYKGRVPLFLHLGIEEEVESAFQRTIRLPSGGSVIFDRSEALVAIDVNSGSSTRHGDITETALKTNLEAAEVVARQLRLRDLGGLIVIDFIGMKEDVHKRQVEDRLLESTSNDRARIQIGHILSRFDVLVMSRQRLRSSLGRVNEEICSACQGYGIQRSIESLALSIIRTVEKKLSLKKVSQIKIEASVELATYLSNEKRDMIYALEKDYQLKLLVLPNPYWKISQYKITSFTHEELATQETLQVMSSYKLLKDSDSTKEAMMPVILSTAEVPAVERFAKEMIDQSNVAQLGLIRKILNKIRGWARVIMIMMNQPGSTAKNSDKVHRIYTKTSSSLKKSSRHLSMNLTNQGKLLDHINRGKVVKRLDKQTRKYVKKVIPSIKQDEGALQSVLDTKDALSPSSTTQPIEKKAASSESSFKRSLVHRYGGEPRLQQRGYQ